MLIMIGRHNTCAVPMRGDVGELRKGERDLRICMQDSDESLNTVYNSLICLPVCVYNCGRAEMCVVIVRGERGSKKGVGIHVYVKWVCNALRNICSDDLSCLCQLSLPSMHLSARVSR